LTNFVEDKIRKKLKVSSHIILIFISLFSVNLYSQNIDSLQKELIARLEVGDSDKVSMNIAEKLFDYSVEINSTKSTEYAGLYVQIAEHLKDSLFIGRGKRMLGLSYLYSDNYFMASSLFFEAYSIFSKQNKFSDKAKTLLLWAKVYIEQENLEMSRQKVKNALEIYRMIGDSSGVFEAKIVNGITFLNSDDSQSLMEFSYAFDIATKEDLENHPEIYEYSAIANYNIGNTKIALDYLIKAKSIFKDQNDLLNLAKTYEIFGDIFFDEDIIEKANENYEKALNLFKDIGLKKNVNIIKLKISKINVDQNNLLKAEQYTNEVISYAQIFNDYKLLKDAYNIMLKIYNKKNNTEKIIEFSNLYIQALKNYYQDKDLKNFSSFEMNIEINQFDRELELLKIKNEKEKLQLAQNQYRKNRIFAVIISFIVLLFIIFLYTRFRERKKVAHSLQQANTKLQKEIEDRKKLEAEALENQKRYKLLFEQSPVGILNFSENLYISEVNDRFLEIFHSKREDIIGQHINRIFDRKTNQSILELFNKTNKSILKTESEIPTKNDVVYLSVTVKKYDLINIEEEYSGGIMIIEDLTEHKKAERFYKTKLLTKQKLIEKNPDSLILIDEDETISAIHLMQSPELELKVNKLKDIITEESTYELFKTHLSKLKEKDDYTQFFINDKEQNMLVRMFNYSGSYLIIISRFEGELTGAKKTISRKELIYNSENKDDIAYIKDDIQKELFPIYQNIQRGLSFLMIKNFAEKIIDLGKKHNNNKIINFGEELLDSLSSFNVIKVNEIIESFPSFISQFMHFSIEF